MANAGLDLFETEPRLEQVRALEQALTEDLTPLAEQSGVRDVRVCGAVAAVEFEVDFDVEAARAWFISRGTFIRPLGRVVYLTPSYVIARDALTELTGAIAEFARTGG